MEAREQRVYGQRHRGRPAKVFSLTDSGRAVFHHDYDALAVDALRFIEESGGEQAVAAFARRRFADLAARYQSVLAEADPAERSRLLAEALTADGYAASTREAEKLPGEQLCQHHCPVQNVAEQFPQLCEVETPGLRRTARHPCPTPRHDRARRRRLHHVHPDGRRGTPARRAPRSRSSTTDPKEMLHDHHSRRARRSRQLRVRLGRPGRRRSHREARPERGRGPRHLRAQERAEVDARLPAQGAAAVRAQADAELGRRPERHRLRQHQVLRPRHRPAGHLLGRPAGGHQGHLRQARHPRGREAAAALRRLRAVRVGDRLPLDQRGPRAPGCHLHGHRHRAQGARGPVPRALQHRHPGRRQQVLRAQLGGLVRRLVHLRAEGRARGDPAAGLLPDQHREHGPVRADADHRGRGLLRALPRGLHRADLQLGLAALARSSRSS